MKFRWKVLTPFSVLLLVCSLGFAGGAKEAEKGPAKAEGRHGGTLRVATSAATPTLDPMATTHIAPREIGMHIFEGIVSFDENHKVVPMLAESWKVSPDGLKYTFALRKDLGKWDLFFSSHSTRFDPVQNSFCFIKDTSLFGYSNPEMEKWLNVGAMETDFDKR